ncbi:MAG: OadG family protein [Lachnospiraceae bacterium]|nr:OadG family protein [Lachnospiraceae bacterium]
MKMKKIALLFSMIAVFFCLTACSDGQEKVNFEYTNTDIIYSSVANAFQLQNASEAYRAYLNDSEDERAEALLSGISNMDNAADECGEFKGYRSKEDGSVIGFDFLKLNSQDQEELLEAQQQLVDFLSFVDATVEEDGANVIVTLPAVYEKRDVEYSFVYVENPAYAYAYDLYQQTVDSYLLKEVTATPDYTFAEKMGKAGANTLMGMGTVFVVLIFISLIIGQFEKLAKVITDVSTKVENWWHNRKNRKNKDAVETQETPAAAAAVSAPAVDSTSNLMNDAQLVAVITAAIAAASGSSGGSDKLVVRSIRKAKR